MTRNDKLREIFNIAQKYNYNVFIIGNDFQVKGKVHEIYYHVDSVLIFSRSLGYITIFFDNITSVI